MKCATWLLLLSAFIAALGASQAYSHTYVETGTTANGSPQVCKDLSVAVTVYNNQGVVIARTEWDGDINKLGENVVSEYSSDNLIKDFEVKVTVRYRGVAVMDESAFIHVDIGKSITVEYNGVRYKLTGSNGLLHLPELKSIRNVDGKEVIVTLDPTVKINSNGLLGTDFTYDVRGTVTVKDGTGEHKAYFNGDVKTPLAVPPIAALGLMFFVPLTETVKVPVSGRDVTVELSIDGGGAPGVTVTASVPGRASATSSIEETPIEFSPGSTSFPLVVEVIRDGRVIARCEYTVELKGYELSPVGTRRVDVEVIREASDTTGDVKFYEPVTLGSCDGTTDVEIPVSVYSVEDGFGGTGLYCVHLVVHPPRYLPRSPDLMLALLEFSTLEMVKALGEALKVPDAVVYEPLSVPRLPFDYAEIGLAACLTAALARYYLPLMTEVTLGYGAEAMDEPGVATVPLALWGMRLISAGTGAPLPVVGGIGKLAQWASDAVVMPYMENLGYECPWDAPTAALMIPFHVYVESFLRDALDLIPYMALGAVDVSLPLPLASYLYTRLDYPLPGLALRALWTTALRPTLEDLMGILSGHLTALLDLTVSTLPLLAFVSLPGWLEWLLALPALTVYLNSLLLAPEMLMGVGVGTEMSADVTVSVPGASADAELVTVPGDGTDVLEEFEEVPSDLPDSPDPSLEPVGDDGGVDVGSLFLEFPEELEGGRVGWIGG